MYQKYVKYIMLDILLVPLQVQVASISVFSSTSRSQWIQTFQMIQISNYKLTTGGFLKSVSQNHRKPQGPNGHEFHLRKLSTLGPRGETQMFVDPEGSHIRR